METTVRDSAAPGRGIALTILGGALLTANDAVLKWLTVDYPVGQLLFVRGLFVLLAVSLIVWRSGGFALIRINSFKAQSTRAGFAITSGFNHEFHFRPVHILSKSVNNYISRPISELISWQFSLVIGDNAYPIFRLYFIRGLPTQRLAPYLFVRPSRALKTN